MLLEWVNEFGEIVSPRNMAALLFPHWALFLPAVATVACWAPGALECLLVFSAWLALAGAALTVNHRFFAHGAFKTSRPGRALLACVACLGLQYGPLWWSSKHRRHHRFCDERRDPHSWKLTSWWYAWFGWICAVEERQIDTAFVHPAMFVDAAREAWSLPAWLAPLEGTSGEGARAAGVESSRARVIAPELLLIDRVWFMPSLLVYVAMTQGLGASYRGVFMFFLGPSMCVPLPILLFNVVFHPPGPTGCCALDSALDPLTVLLGESAHEDHHRVPSRIKRPSPLPWDLDLCYEGLLRPLLWLGVIWDPQFGPRGKNEASRRGD
jgi:stearoyl-CoA desaturase (delta-9 desaturase)